MALPHTLFFTSFCLLAAVPVAALDLTLLQGTQGGGRLQHIVTEENLQFDTTPVQALVIGAPSSGFQDLELFYSRQQTSLEEGGTQVPSNQLFDLDVHYLHLGGTVLSERWYGLQGFLSGGLGVSHFSPSLSGAEAENRTSMSVGLGARWMPTQHIGLRLEGRLFGTLFNSNTRIFCSGGCSFSVNGDLLTQHAVFAGLTLHLD